MKIGAKVRIGRKVGVGAGVRVGRRTGAGVGLRVGRRRIGAAAGIRV